MLFTVVLQLHLIWRIWRRALRNRNTRFNASYRIPWELTRSSTFYENGVRPTPNSRLTPTPSITCAVAAKLALFVCLFARLLTWASSSSESAAIGYILSGRNSLCSFGWTLAIERNTLVIQYTLMTLILTRILSRPCQDKGLSRYGVVKKGTRECYLSFKFTLFSGRNYTGFF